MLWLFAFGLPLWVFPEALEALEEPPAVLGLDRVERFDGVCELSFVVELPVELREGSSFERRFSDPLVREPVAFFLRLGVGGRRLVKSNSKTR